VRRWPFEDGLPDEIEDWLFEDNDAHVVGSFVSGDEQVDNPVGFNVVAFASVTGSGIHETWVGVDHDERPVCLLADFAL
jgi:hypothetical protein